MARIVLLIAVGLIALIAWRRFQSLSGAQRKKYLWQVAAITGGTVLALLVVTGRLHWIGAAVAAAIPLLKRMLPLALPLLQHLKRSSGAPPDSADQHSTVQTAILRMQLDHSTGLITGLVTDGPCQGQQLEQLSERELLTLYQYCCQQDPDSARVLQGYLDQRLGTDWHAQKQQDNTTASGVMSAEEALAILGLEPGADREQILQAHRRLMQKLHPDRGGNDYLAAQLNRARDQLLA